MRISSPVQTHRTLSISAEVILNPEEIPEKWRTETRVWDDSEGVIAGFTVERDNRGERRWILFTNGARIQVLSTMHTVTEQPSSDRRLP